MHRRGDSARPVETWNTYFFHRASRPPNVETEAVVWSEDGELSDDPAVEVARRLKGCCEVVTDLV